jgi:hypothetical protein
MGAAGITIHRMGMRWRVHCMPTNSEYKGLVSTYYNPMYYPFSLGEGYREVSTDSIQAFPPSRTTHPTTLVREAYVQQ